MQRYKKIAIFYVPLSTYMKLEKRLEERLHLGDIRQISAACCDVQKDAMKDELFSLVSHTDDRVGYNALWIFTHFPAEDMKWLVAKRVVLTNLVLKTDHVGKRRLILTLLEHLPIKMEDIRTDYLDFCLSKINSTEPYAIRALCLKQSYAMCRFYPELMAELKNQIELMEYGELSPGLLSVIRRIKKRI